jgi:hypothetical protein
MNTETQSVTRRARSLVTAVTVGALALAGGAAVMLATAAGASASSTADLSVSQSISAATASGSTTDTVTIHDASATTSSHVNLTLLLTTRSHVFAVHSNVGTCQILVPPAGFQLMASCQFASVPARHSLKDTLTYSGTAGLAFTSYVTVGQSSPADPSYKNNHSTVSSWFGPRADLALSETAAPGATAGTAKIVSTVADRGPNNAVALQLIIEIKSSGYHSVHAASNVSASCQFIPAASGYTRAVSCTTNSLKTGAKWIITCSYTGTDGASLVTKTSTSANTPADPVTSNNVSNKSTTYKS